jgi:hypothetical protein
MGDNKKITFNTVEITIITTPKTGAKSKMKFPNHITTKIPKAHHNQNSQTTSQPKLSAKNRYMCVTGCVPSVDAFRDTK